MKYYLYAILLILISGCNEPELKSPSSYEAIINALPNNPQDCKQDLAGLNHAALVDSRCNWLSNFNLFSTLITDEIIPNSNGFIYELNSELFTDFAQKKRFVFLPDDKKMLFSHTGNFIFPIGSTLVKIFSLPYKDTTKIKEIRLSIKRENGWVYLPYIWSEDKQDAFFYREGIKIPSTIKINSDITFFTYETPSASNCQECHRSEYSEETLSFRPIGPKARHLNKIIDVNGEMINQLVHWKRVGYLSGLPDDLTSIDTAPNWRDTNEDIQERAKAYLDINCAHCHSEGGSAALSGLRLEYWKKSIGHSHGVCNSSHGWRGGGFDIWPGLGEISSIPIRMRHIAAKDRMPPIGRSLVDEEAVQLISDWIDTLPYEECAK